VVLGSDGAPGAPIEKGAPPFSSWGFWKVTLLVPEGEVWEMMFHGGELMNPIHHTPAAKTSWNMPNPPRIDVL